MKVTVVPGISDHNCPLMELDVKPTRRRQLPREVPIYKKADWDSFEHDLRETRDKLNQSTDASVSDLWKMFKDAITEGMLQHIPTKMLKIKDSLPYITPEITKLIKRRDRLYKNKKKKQRHFDWSTPSHRSIEEKLRNIKREIQLKSRRAYWKYIESIITPEDTESTESSYLSMKRFWSFIKQNRKDYTGIPPLNANGKHSTNSKEKANMLNEQFESVFSSANPTNSRPKPAEHPCMNDINITENGVLKLLQSLQIHKASGPEKMSARILKQLVPMVAPMLTTVFRRSYETGEVR